MWALKVVSGAQSGQVFKLPKGKVKFGRSTSVDFTLQGSGISKEHFTIEVVGRKVLLTDLNSSNGTFVNGVKVQSQVLEVGDSIVLQNIILVLVEVVVKETFVPPQSFVPVSKEEPSGSLPPSLLHLEGSSPSSLPQASTVNSVDISTTVQSWVDSKVLPAFEGLLRAFSLRAVIFIFAGVFGFLATFLGLLPMKAITSESIGKESQRRAQTIARSLAAHNEKILSQDELSRFTTELFINEDGVQDIYVLSDQGKILAPVDRRNQSPREIEFVKAIRGQMRGVATTLTDGRIGASFPIVKYDPQTQRNEAAAHIVVIYDPGSLKFDDQRALSLFIQSFLMCLLVGGLLFWLLSRLLDQVVWKVKEQLDQVLRGEKSEVRSDLAWEPLQKLLVDINHLLQRSQTGSGAGAIPTLSWLESFLEAAFVLDSELKFHSANTLFGQKMGQQREALEGHNLESLQDNYLQSQILDCVQRLQTQGGGVVQVELEYQGEICELVATYLGPDQHFILIKLRPVSAHWNEGAA